jgi:hypothetical protein
VSRFELSKKKFFFFFTFFGMGTLVGAWWWSGEVLLGHWPAFEVIFHIYFSCSLYVQFYQKLQFTKSGLTTNFQHVVSQVWIENNRGFR